MDNTGIMHTAHLRFHERKIQSYVETGKIVLDLNCLDSTQPLYLDEEGAEALVCILEAALADKRR